MPNVTITVKDSIKQLREKNPKPSRRYTQSELVYLVQALLQDTEYRAQHTQIKKGEPFTSELNLNEQWQKGLADILRQVGLSKAEAAEQAAKLTVPKSLAEAIVNAVRHGSWLYMSDIKKGMKFMGSSDVDQTFYLRTIGTKQHRIPADKDGKPRAHKAVEIGSHDRLAVKTRLINPNLKKLIK